MLLHAAGIHYSAWQWSASKLNPACSQHAQPNAGMRRSTRHLTTSPHVQAHWLRRRFGSIYAFDYLVNSNQTQEVKASVIPILAKLGAVLNPSFNTHHYPLLDAIRRSEPKVVSALLAAGADPNYQNIGHTPLQSAAYYGNTALVTLLLNAGASARGVDLYGGTALTMAMNCNCSFELVSALMAAGADVNARAVSTFHGQSFTALTRLMETWGHEDVPLLKLFLDAGADLEVLMPVHEDSILTAAVWTGNAEAVRMLIEKGANVNPPGDPRDSPLRAAMKARNPVMIALLRNAGARLL